MTTPTDTTADTTANQDGSVRTRKGLPRYNRPRLGELVTLREEVDMEAYRIAEALAAWVGDIDVERHLQVENVPNWYNRTWFAGIKVNGHTVTRGSIAPTKRVFYVLVDEAWVELTDPSQIL